VASSSSGLTSEAAGSTSAVGSSVELTITANDRDAYGQGGATTATATTPIRVVSVNDPPRMFYASSDFASFNQDDDDDDDDDDDGCDSSMHILGAKAAASETILEGHSLPLLKYSPSLSRSR